MKDLTPSEGGCWFCFKDECDAFDYEFDTYVHLDCVRKALKESNGEDCEAKFMKYLLEEDDGK
jgi:hypothetical protein